MRSNRMRARPANSMEDSFESYDDDAATSGANSARDGSPGGGSHNLEDVLVAMTGSKLRLEGTGSSSNVSVGVGGNEGGSEQVNDLPRSIVVTSVDLQVFDNESTKATFEGLFREFDTCAVFCYLRSFRRVRIDFNSHMTAAAAKANLDGQIVADSIIHCYFVQVLSPCTLEDSYLHVPPLEKQFLISPPASPPVGWEQPKEDKPVVDYDLLAAMAQLAPGEIHELIPTKEINVLGKSISTPSIVVHIADEPIPIYRPPTKQQRIRQTRCPERQASLD